MEEKKMGPKENGDSSLPEQPNLTEFQVSVETLNGMI